MKCFLFFMAIIAAAIGIQSVDPFAERSISTTISEALEDIRDQMPCGFPKMGIPPLAPLKIPQKKVDIDTPVLQLHGSIENFRLNGLNDFEIVDMKVNAILSKVTFRFVFKNVNVDTKYDLRMVLKKAGFTVNVVGKGSAKVAIKDMHIWGTMKYSFGILSGKLKLKTLEVRTHIGDVDSDIQGILGEGTVNHKINAFIAEAVELAVNENEDMITQTIETVALPVVNSVLEDVSLSDLIAAGGEKEPCIPAVNAETTY